MDRCPPSRASAARVLGGCRGPLYGLGWQLGRTQHDDFAATLGPRALRSPKRACASKTESSRPAEALLRSTESKAAG